MSIDDDDDVEFEAPPPPLPCTDTVVPFLGGERPPSTPNMLSAFESATVPPQKTARRLKRPRRRPCRRNRPRAPNNLDEAIPSHPQPMMGGTSTPTTTLMSAQANDRDPRSHLLRPNPPHPMSYVGALLSPRGGDCEPSSTVLQSTPATDSAAIALHQMARRRKRPRRRPGRRNVPRAPNPPDEATPSHPRPTMGGTTTPTPTLPSARVNDRDHRSNMSSPSLLPMTLPSPSHQPFTIEGGNSTYSGGGFNDSFRDNGASLPPRKCPRRKYRPRRVCRRHSPRAPNPLDHLHCGGRHRPRASNQSTVS
jgi:hypothetical protein